MNNPCDSVKAIYPTQVTTFSEILFSILCQNSFFGTFSKNTNLETLLALVSLLGKYYFHTPRLISMNEAEKPTRPEFFSVHRQKSRCFR